MVGDADPRLPVYIAGADPTGPSPRPLSFLNALMLLLYSTALEKNSFLSVFFAGHRIENSRVGCMVHLKRGV